jgi:hypothetical protein
MTNTEHNEKILAEIMQLQERLEHLKSQIKPADDLPTVDLLACNAGAVDARAQKFSQQARVKAVIAEVMSKTDNPQKKKVPRDADKA